jgi:hypothetical protein
VSDFRLSIVVSGDYAKQLLTWLIYADTSIHPLGASV